jgi:single-stranded-DNA-specific exonuclease
MASTQHNSPFLLAADSGWHAGVVGIVAGRLKDRFNKPAFVVGFQNEMGRGSARSVSGVDLGAIVRAARDAGILEAGGGHAMAAGFSVAAAKLESFREFLAAQFVSAGEATTFELNLDAAISPAGATPALVSDIARAGPFGSGNPEPMVVIPDARIVFADVVGKDHVRLRLAGGDGAGIDAIAFRASNTSLGKVLLSSRGRQVHAAGRLRLDEWNGRVRVQLHLEDAATSQQ